MQIDISNLQDEVKINRKYIREVAKKILRILNENNAELSLCFTDDAGIQRLNKNFRQVNSPTDVLAFPMRGADGMPKGTNMLGDVIISLQTAKSEAERRKKDIKEEMLLYLTHGILHLLGYRDDTLDLRLKMRDKETELLRQIIKG